MSTSETPYNNREIKAMFKHLERKIDDGFDGVHKRQDKTNGNVSENTRWRYLTVGALSIITTILLPIAWLVIDKLT